MRISIQSGADYLYMAEMEQSQKTSATDGTDTTNNTANGVSHTSGSNELLADFQSMLNDFIDKQRVARGLSPLYSNTSTVSASYGATSGQVNSVGIIVPDEYKAYFEEAARTYGVDQNLLEIIAAKESNFISTATSPAGAMGIMQLMPSTAEGLGVSNPYDARENIMGGAKYIVQKINEYNGDVSLALAAYNAGSGNVAKYGGIPPFTETQNYVAWIMDRYNSMS